MVFATVAGLMSHFRSAHAKQASGVLCPAAGKKKPQKIRGGLTVGKMVNILAYCDRHPLYSNSLVAEQLGRKEREVRRVRQDRARIKK